MVLLNCAVYNIGLLVVITTLYNKRAKFEEDIMAHDDLYVEYIKQVKYRFIQGIL